MNLIKTELKKTNFKAYLNGSLGIFTGILAMGILFLFIPVINGAIPAINGMDRTGEELFRDWNGILMLTSVLHFVGFGILAAVVASKLIIGEYSGKSAAVILCYPISRKRILNAKYLIIFGFITIIEFLSCSAVMAVVFAVSKIKGAELIEPNIPLLILVPCIGILSGLLSPAMGIISVTIGWKKRSVPAAIVSSFIAGCLLAQCFSFSYKNILAVTAVVCIVTLMVSFFVYGILAKSIDEMEV